MSTRNVFDKVEFHDAFALTVLLLLVVALVGLWIAAIDAAVPWFFHFLFASLAVFAAFAATAIVVTVKRR